MMLSRLKMLMRTRHTKNERGFTIGEVMMVASLLTFASTGVVSLIHRSDKNARRAEELAYQQFFSKGRGTVDQMVTELDQAGTPAAFEGVIDSDPATSNHVATPRYLVATPTQVIFDGDIDHDGIVERVAYRLNGNTLERSVTPKSSDGTVPEPRYEAVAQNVENGEMPLFSYTGDPFGLNAADGSADAVRILLLLRAPVTKTRKQTSMTVGFEGVAHRPNAVAARQHPEPEQGELIGGSASSDLTNIASTDLPFGEFPTAGRYANKWTMR